MRLSLIFFSSKSLEGSQKSVAIPFNIRPLHPSAGLLHAIYPPTTGRLALEVGLHLRQQHAVIVVGHASLMPQCLDRIEFTMFSRL
jgi:hypothetical protein